MEENKNKRKKTVSQREDKLLKELDSHYQKWSEDNDQRRTRKNGWIDITRAYWGELPKDWPFISRTTDPRIRTSVIEKDARLLNKKPKGRVVPRGETSDMIKAEIQNMILSKQWDNADHGGSMQEKLVISSQDTRLYSTKFAYVPWIEEKDQDGNFKFVGNEMIPWDIRDCGMDFNASHIRDAKWFQHRKWMFVEDMENENKASGKTIWKNLGFVKSQLANDAQITSDKRDNERVSTVRSIQGLTDRVGDDEAYPVLLVITEYREDRWISFVPRFNTVVRNIKNPFKHGKIPVAQLRYYPIQDDALGESEVESVLSLWKGIQATVCGFLDEMILKMRPPLKIIENKVRLETLEYGPEAQWLMDTPDAVTEMRSNGEAQRWFQTSYSALVSAFNTAMGDMSQGVSNIEAFSGEKTATEVKQSAKQQNARDQRNQNEMSDFITDIMRMWISNNRQFLFSNEDKEWLTYKLVGAEAYEKFKKMKLADMELSDEGMVLVQDVMKQTNYKMSDRELADIVEAASIPSNPMVENPDEKNIDKLRVRPKLEINEDQDTADIYVTPIDFDGDYDFILDVKSMEMGSGFEYIQSRQQAIQMMTDPSIQGMLQLEGWKPKVKDLIVSILNEGGLNDSQKYFERAEDPAVQEGAAQAGGATANQQAGGVPNVPAPPSNSSLEQQMART